MGRAPPQSRSSGPPTRGSVPRHVPPRNLGTGSGPLPGAGVGPSPGGVEAEKKVEASELLQALSSSTNHDAGRLCKVPSLGGSETETWED